MSGPGRPGLVPAFAELGVTPDPAARLAHARSISSTGSSIPALDVPIHEERVIATDTVASLAPGP